MPLPCNLYLKLPITTSTPTLHQREIVGSGLWLLFLHLQKFNIKDLTLALLDICSYSQSIPPEPPALGARLFGSPMKRQRLGCLFGICSSTWRFGSPYLNSTIVRISPIDIITKTAIAIKSRFSWIIAFLLLQTAQRAWSKFQKPGSTGPRWRWKAPVPQGRW